MFLLQNNGVNDKELVTDTVPLYIYIYMYILMVNLGTFIKGILLSNFPY